MSIIRMEQTAAVVTVFAGSKSMGQKQSKNTGQSGLLVGRIGKSSGELGRALFYVNIHF